jgi:cullin 1
MVPTVVTECLQATKVYFEEESTKYLADNSLPDYMKQVHTRVQQEDDRVQRVLHQSSAKKLGTTVRPTVA